MHHLPFKELNCHDSVQVSSRFWVSWYRFVFVIRCLESTTFVEKTFCVDTVEQRTEWMEAIQKVADDILQQEKQLELAAAVDKSQNSNNMAEVSCV